MLRGRAVGIDDGFGAVSGCHPCDAHAGTIAYKNSSIIVKNGTKLERMSQKWAQNMIKMPLPIGPLEPLLL